MIAHVRGRVAHRDTGSVVVDVQGVGYLVHVTPGDRIPPRGEPLELYTSLQVREDAMTLYGFTDRGSLTLFELLLTSSGVGPRLALAALGTHRPEVLRTAIAGGDLATLTAVPGIGRKVAERLVLELKDKVGSPAGGDLAVIVDGDGHDALAEVRDALLGLGYSAGETQAALAAVGTADDRDAGGADTAELLKRALRHLGAAAFDGARR